MSKLCKAFVQSTAEALADPKIQGILGENFPKVDAVVKAAIGIDDSDALTKIILILIPGLDMSGLSAVADAISNPMTMILAIRNTDPGERDEDEQ